MEILVRDGLAYLGDCPLEAWTELVDATSFELEGMEHRIKGRGRDKRTKLIRARKCPVGLLDRVCRTLELNGVTPRVSYADTQMIAKPRVAMGLSGVELRDYQVEAELAAQLADRGIYRLPTGSGKTLLALAIAAAKGYHTVIIVPTIDLLYQFKDQATIHLARSGPGGWAIGQLGDGVVDPQPVTIATIRTMAKVLDVAFESYEYGEYDDKDETKVNPRELKEWVESLGTVIFDEAHQVAARVAFDTMAKIPALYKYGMSASPWRDDGADLMIEAATGPPIYHISARRLVQEGFLLAPQFRIYDTSSWWESAAWGAVCVRCGKQRERYGKACSCGSKDFKSQWQESYREEIVQNTVRNARIAQIVKDLNVSGRSVLVLVKQVNHGRELAGMIPEAIFLSGKNRGQQRHDTFDQMRAGQIGTLVCTSIADQGLDLPQLGALVLAAGGKSSTRHLQRIGRVVRPWPGKPRPVVIDLDDSHIHSWYANHFKRRRKMEWAEWGDAEAEWVYE